MRLTPSLIRRSLAAALVVLGGAACADLATQPDATSRPIAARFDAIDSEGTAADSGTSFNLLVCPTADAASESEVIGPEGGTIGARGTSITIPPGAVPEPTLFELVVPASPYLRVDIRAAGADHYEFLAPATISINYARCPSDAVPPAAKLQGVHVDGATGQVLQEMGGMNDRSGHKVSFPTWHLSGYIVAY